MIDINSDLLYQVGDILYQIQYPNSDLNAPYMVEFVVLQKNGCNRILQFKTMERQPQDILVSPHELSSFRYTETGAWLLEAERLFQVSLENLSSIQSLQNKQAEIIKAMNRANANTIGGTS